MRRKTCWLHEAKSLESCLVEETLEFFAVPGPTFGFEKEHHRRARWGRLIARQLLDELGAGFVEVIEGVSRLRSGGAGVRRRKWVAGGEVAREFE